MSDTPPRDSLLPNCREIHRLTMEGMDRPLSWIERVRMRGHLAICDACTHFSAQMRLMRAAMSRLGLDDEPPKDNP
ncbi:zf-HC2 domain-containing protein [Cupriavidus basilensis]|jgi:hypothetical protein|uniref:zf-HC2 domain-containing protein n=1 Tax=Cupriavidus TaxID=106589 RepID=UPI000445768C|nr:MULTISPECIES: zf-HC2 domain-containing protein [Cupriavidus]KDP83820.1 hypothetical protein CF70_022805 [Cupriavidus sp. SK-3]MDF3885951.1 zf-HC2 domain-containing protein [Cupriavidus basilensis]